MTKLNSKVPSGPLAEKWDKHRFDIKLVNPANKRKFEIIVVGTGLAGASAAATLAELGYRVKVIGIHDSPRRAHSIAAQGGINAAKNYPGDNDSVYRLFYDTIKGGDYRSREANTYRLAQVSNNIIDQCVAQGVPFARDYGGYLANRSFGGAQVSRTFYARGQTGQQLLLGAYSALSRQIGKKQAEMLTRREVLDLIVIDGRARGVVVRRLVDGKMERHVADAVIYATGGYGNAYFLSTNAQTSNGSAAWQAYKKGAMFANPCYVQIHPTCLPIHGENQSKRTLMSESLRNDGRVWVPKKQNDTRAAKDIPENERDYYLETRYPAFGNLVPRDVASRNAKEVCDDGRGVGVTKQAVYLDFAESIGRLGKDVIAKRYGNLFDMYQSITDHNPYEEPMQIYPAIHYTMGGLWVDYNLQSTIPGLFVLGEANFSDHGANRLGASALMQGLADGYFVIPYSIGNYLGANKLDKVSTDNEAFGEAEEAINAKIDKLLKIKGSKTVLELHRDLGQVLWDNVGMARDEKGLKEALVKIPKIREEFWNNLKIPGGAHEFNQSLDRAIRVADYMEFAELEARDALARNESCGGHFRLESVTDDGEAKRDDENFAHVAAWEYMGPDKEPVRNEEELVFENVKLTQRSYK